MESRLIGHRLPRPFFGIALSWIIPLFTNFKFLKTLSSLLFISYIFYFLYLFPTLLNRISLFTFLMAWVSAGDGWLDGVMIAETSSAGSHWPSALISIMRTSTLNILRIMSDLCNEIFVQKCCFLRAITITYICFFVKRVQLHMPICNCKLEGSFGFWINSWWNCYWIERPDAGYLITRLRVIAPAAALIQLWWQPPKLSSC